MPTSDERLAVGAANQLLSDLHVYRCALCGLARVESMPIYAVAKHARCGGAWRSVEQPLARAVLLRFLAWEMLSGGPRWQRDEQ